jgi:hypothetical protein
MESLKARIADDIVNHDIKNSRALNYLHELIGILENSVGQAGPEGPAGPPGPQGPAGADGRDASK